MLEDTKWFRADGSRSQWHRVVTVAHCTEWKVDVYVTPYPTHTGDFTQYLHFYAGCGPFRSWSPVLSSHSSEDLAPPSDGHPVCQRCSQIDKAIEAGKPVQVDREYSKPGLDARIIRKDELTDGRN